MNRPPTLREKLDSWLWWIVIVAGLAAIAFSGGWWAVQPIP